MTTIPSEDPNLARLIESHLDGDPAATRALDARLATDPDAALAFAKAHRLEALLEIHHQRVRAKFRLARILRPLAWLGAAAAVGLLAWVAFRPETSPQVVAEPVPATIRKVLPPLRMAPSPKAPPREASLSAAEIERKASNFYLPMINVNTTSLEDVVAEIQREFRRIAARHGDASAETIQFTTRDFDDADTRESLPGIRIASGGSVRALLAAAALQAGGLLSFDDGAVTIARVKPGSGAPESAMQAFPLPGRNLLSLLTGTAPPTESPEDADDPFGDQVSRITVPEIAFEGATIEEAVASVREKSRALDPRQEGLNVILKKPATGQVEPLTLRMENSTLGQIMERIAEEAGLKAVAQEHAIVIAAANDPLIAVRPEEFTLGGLRASYNSRDSMLALEGDGSLVEAASVNLGKLHATPMQVLITGKIVCVVPADLYDSSESEVKIDLSPGSQILEEDEFQEIFRRAKHSRGSVLTSAPSVVTRASQRAKIEVIREVLYRVPTSDDSLVVEMAPVGWTLECDPEMIGEALLLTGAIEFSSLEKAPVAGDFATMSPELPPSSLPSRIDPESVLIGDPSHKWALDFEAELRDGQCALLDFMDLADGKKVYVLIRIVFIDPAGQPINPPRN